MKSKNLFSRESLIWYPLSFSLIVVRRNMSIIILTSFLWDKHLSCRVTHSLNGGSQWPLAQTRQAVRIGVYHNDKLVGKKADDSCRSSISVFTAMRNYTIILLSAILILLITDKGYFLFWTGLISPHAKFCISVIFRTKEEQFPQERKLSYFTHPYSSKNTMKNTIKYTQNINANFTISTGKKSLSQPSPETAAEF